MKRLIAWFCKINNNFVYTVRYDLLETWSPSPQLLSHRLDPGTAAHDAPFAGRVLIARSRDYLEIADWGYCHVGPVLLALVIAFVGGSFTYIAGNVASAFSPFVTGAGQLVAPIVLLPGLLLAAWGGRPLYLHLTAYTHYPIRLDRKNGMVHVFKNGSSNGVMSIPWNELSFGIGCGTEQVGVVARAICGYRMRPDGTFDWFHMGIADRDPDFVMRQWEYFRRFMEKGSEGLPEPPVLLGIDRKRESFATGAKNCWLSAGHEPVDQIPVMVITVPGSLIRWILMRVARRPMWPEHIISMAPISVDDPYARRPESGKDVHGATVWLVTIHVLLFDVALSMASFYFFRR